LDGLQLNDDSNDDAVELPSIRAVSGGHTRDSGYEGGEKTTKNTEGRSLLLNDFPKHKPPQTKFISSLVRFGGPKGPKSIILIMLKE
jgi:hypothetical protein